MKHEYIMIDGKRIDVKASLREISKVECSSSLSEFIAQAWHVVEPGQEYVHNWHIDLICDSLEAITDGVMVDDERY